VKTRTAVAGVVLSALALTAPAAATPIAGENGRIVLTSYQNFGASRAELFLLPVPFSSGGGTLSAPIATSATERHRHPTWSPDRTKIAYARGVSAGNTYDIFVQDLTQPVSATNPVNITQSAGSNDDRPAWSPDGAHIAFERDSGVPADRDIVVSLPNGGGQTDITNTTGLIEGKPAWDPTSSTIYYEKGNAQNAATNTDIVKRSISFSGGVATIGAETLAVADDAGHPEIQPSISPNGDKICYGTGYPGAPSTDIKVAALTGSPAVGSKVSMSSTAYYCTWSPDNTMVAYTAGAGSAGNLVMVRADGSSSFEIPLASGADIQTNPDWAPDGRPECPNSTATVTSGQAVTIPVNCTDTGPQYERSDVREFISTQPQHGTATQDLAGDPISYKPNAKFTGTDFIEIGSFDDFGFGSDKGTIAISVTPPTCLSKKATITGTKGNDVISGTKRADVIVALGGKDRIRGRGGNDLICGNNGNDQIRGDGGNDRISGGMGNDRLDGGAGKDRLDGGPGTDTCIGGKGHDTSASCSSSQSIP
jgi:Ca2+-binding RTX toxin-like protein